MEKSFWGLDSPQEVPCQLRLCCLPIVCLHNGWSKRHKVIFFFLTLELFFFSKFSHWNKINNNNKKPQTVLFSLLVIGLYFYWWLSSFASYLPCDPELSCSQEYLFLESMLYQHAYDFSYDLIYMLANKLFIVPPGQA